MKIKHLVKILNRLNAQRITYYFKGPKFVGDENISVMFDRITVTKINGFVGVHIYFAGLLIAFLKNENLFNQQINYFDDYSIDKEGQ